MNRQKQIVTRINNLLECLAKLLENNLDIRRELLKIREEMNAPDSLEDIYGIRVYKGADFCRDESPERIIIGEEIEGLEDLDEEEIEENNSFYMQDCGGNIIPVEIPVSYKGVVNATFTLSDTR
jgi:hypothetical protein